MSGTLRGEIWGLSFAVAHSDSMTNKDQNTYISTYMKHKNIFQNRLKSYSEKIHFFSDQTLDIYRIRAITAPLLIKPPL